MPRALAKSGKKVKKKVLGALAAPTAERKSILSRGPHRNPVKKERHFNIIDTKEAPCMHSACMHSMRERPL